MAGPGSKAKLAHERSSQSGDLQQRRFSFQEIVEVTEHDGKRVVVVTLDASGERGLIPGFFVHKVGNTEEWEPSPMACPAVYCDVRRKEAVDALAHFESQRAPEPEAAEAAPAAG
ncbi:MAG TPA: hypothetical protein DCQ06_03135 [Myxococcales bacterium]|nr:hypothetical protein [Myxococcales bacterium]HAN30569.1 hypothetical protein [Myxococcales bacterium]|tara:strand:+ start:378 stop:722 length:345 start_codon:yes stop_codon:yes gene_type:complete